MAAQIAFAALNPTVIEPIQLHIKIVRHYHYFDQKYYQLLTLFTLGQIEDASNMKDSSF